MLNANLQDKFHLETPEPTQEELDNFLAQANFLDPKGEGFTTAQMKPLQPRMPWNVFYKRLKALEAQGKIRIQTLTGAKNAVTEKFFVIR